jgi:hypothetical protein
MTSDKPLWTCPKCGAKFVIANTWHSCGRWTVESFLKDNGPTALQLFKKLNELVEGCGAFELAPTKSEVAFMVRVRFAQVKRLSERGMTVAFWLKHRIESPRFRRVDFIPPSNWIYTFRVVGLDELDD